MNLQLGSGTKKASPCPKEIPRYRASGILPQEGQRVNQICYCDVLQILCVRPKSLDCLILRHEYEYTSCHTAHTVNKV